MNHHEKPTQQTVPATTKNKKQQKAPKNHQF
jgi:hypothetical protein